MSTAPRTLPRPADRLSSSAPLRPLPGAAAVGGVERSGSPRRVALSAIGPGRETGAASAATPRRAFVASKAVGSFVPKLTKAAFEKYGFSAAALLTDWTAIVGQELSRVTVPERLKWPRWVERGGEVAPGAEGRPGATLVLKVDMVRALDVEYRRAEIVDRVNAYFGYRAVAELKVVQVPAGSLAASSSGAPVPRAAPAATPAPVAPLPEISEIANDGLRAALARMQAAIAAGKGRRG